MPKEYHLAKLSPRHREAMRLMLMGKQLNEICARVNLSKSTMTRIRKDPLFIAEYKRFSDEADRRAVARSRALDNPALEALAMNSIAAAHKIINTMHNAESEALQFKAAVEILDRTNVSAAIAVDKTTGAVSIDNFTQTNIQAGLAGVQLMGERATTGVAFTGAVSTPTTRDNTPDVIAAIDAETGRLEMDGVAMPEEADLIFAGRSNKRLVEDTRPENG